MKTLKSVVPAIILFLGASYLAEAQFPAWYQYSLMPSGGAIDLLAGESSGERAYQHIVEMAGYARLRNLSEFSGDLMETAYVTGKLREYGLRNVTVDRFGTVRTWQGVTASLWEISPTMKKIADLQESPLMLASGSADIDAEADLVYADAGTVASGFAAADVKGKIVFTAERPSSVLARATQAGALAVISCNSPRPFENALMIPATSAGGRGGGQPGTLFLLSPREGDQIIRRLQSGEKIRIRAHAVTTYVDAELQVTNCLIEGTDTGSEEIIITAHVFEGYVKTGGNDNISGSAAILEAARVLNKLIEDGSIPRPKRNIRFLWVPEFSGTTPWVAANRNIIEKSLCNINLDMVGLSLAKWRSFFVLHRTSYGNAHYVGDVIESLFRYVGETNKVNSVVSGSRFFKPIIAPTGTDDPFLYQIESASGGSDHMVFNDLGVMVPGIMMITWPDPFYHTSEDLADKCDPTQLKRTAFITAGAAWLIATAGPGEAMAIAAETASNALRRMGITQSMASDLLNEAGVEKLHETADVMVAKVKGTALGEIMILNSVRELAPADKTLNTLIDNHISSIRKISEGQAAMIASQASSLSLSQGGQPYSYREGNAEKEASKIIPRLLIDYRDSGYRGYQSIIGRIPQEEMANINLREIADPQEALKLINGINSLLDIKFILDSQYSRETSLAVLTGFFNGLRKAGVTDF